MGWQRFNRTSRIFEVSDDNGGSWQPLKIAVAGFDVPVLPANIAYTNVNNNFVAQSLASASEVAGGNSMLLLRDTSAPADAKIWRILNYSNGGLYFEPMNDAFNAVLSSPLTLTRAGSVVTGGLTTLGRLNVGTDAVKCDLMTTLPIYPGRLDTGWTVQGVWYLGSHASYGLYTNTGFYAEGAVFTNALFRCSGSGKAGGVYFPFQSGGHDAVNVLDTYWEGTWAPVFTAQSGQVQNCTVSNNTYVKIGRLVFVNAYVYMNTVIGTGIIFVSGFPFAFAGDGMIPIQINSAGTYSGTFIPWMHTPGGIGTANLYAWGASGAVLSIMDKCKATTDFRISGCYMTAE